ncbi:exported hypothetical protein [Vibrio nigripulchritudo SOn1]|uniref:Trimeric autotransporter adhesin YadA-like C-terminal membrane anchor domain-containing protein n=1 Tax=Vibrio nigripulchritudo SOn1 TaxID=1238450 RepID=A0AAV2VXK1_9VIBR|nr:YadA C-terminal domain-containing protein [Vibrio nigripulchritudo]CCO49482.1 exported hypothetical protein [Vibrio nigripulchritudo SOn1]
MKKAILATALLSTFSMGASAAINGDIVEVNKIDGLLKENNLVARESADGVTRIFANNGQNNIAEIRRNADGTYTLHDNHENSGSVNLKVKDGIVSFADVENKPLPDADKARRDAEINQNKNDIEEANKRAESVDRAINNIEDAIFHGGNEIVNAASAIDNRVNSLEIQFEQMAQTQLQQSRRIDQNEGKMSNGIAGVAAMANIPTVSGKTTFGAGIGHFNGSNAIAIGASTGFENGVSLKGSLSYAKGKWDQKDVVVGAGIGYSF